MSRLKQTPKALEGFSFTVTEAQATAIYLFLNENGFESNAEGLKEFLLVHSGFKEKSASFEGVPEPEEENKLAKDLNKIFSAINDNPQVIHYAKREGAKLFGSLVRRVLLE